MMPENITIRIPKKLRKQLEYACTEEKVGVSDLVRESLSRYLAVKRFRKLRDKILPFAEARGILTDEDVFREIS